MSDTKKVDLQAAQRVLDTATYEYDAAAAVTEIARRDETAALNRLNAAQKAFDAALAEIRKAAPARSDWQQRTKPLR